MSNENVEPTPTPSPEPTPTPTPTPDPAAEAPKAEEPKAEPKAEPKGEEKPKSLLDGDDGPKFDAKEIAAEGLKAFLPEGAELDPVYGPKLVETINGATSREELAKGLIDLHTEMTTKAAEAQAEAWQSTITEWQEAVKADPVYGGANMEGSLANARQLVEQYGGDVDKTTGKVNAQQVTELKEALALTGIGNHVALVRLLNNLKAAIPGEAKPVEGKPAPTQKNRADSLFGGAT